MSNPNTTQSKKGMTLQARVCLFFLLPLFVGSFGLFLSFFKTKVLNQKDSDIDFDRDFIIPFFVTFVLVTVVMIQTSGFASSKAEPLISWPKVIKKKKITKKMVIVDDDGNVIEDEELLSKLEKKKRNASKKED
mmetsp:Transcript_7407/g.8469  ORF Transcript_7407/g.8469 Transcript_7407/m.8469 type:complete len:134 (+) Transcript_7407:62-463(+)